MTPAQARSKFGGSVAEVTSEKKSVGSPANLPQEDNYTLEKSVSSYVSEFVAKTKALGKGGEPKAKAKHKGVKEVWPPPPESSGRDSQRGSLSMERPPQDSHRSASASAEP